MLDLGQLEPLRRGVMSIVNATSAPTVVKATVEDGEGLRHEPRGGISMSTTMHDTVDVDTLAECAVGYLSGAAVSALVCLGDQLGLYRELADIGPATSSELAASAGLNERWVREWLHGQVGAGLVRHAGHGRFELTADQAAVLADEDHPAFLAGGFGLLFSLFQRWERLPESFRTGRGTPYNDLGTDHARNESRFSAPWMRAKLVPVILPGLEGVTGKLAAGAKVADVGCGSGRAMLEMASTYPASEFHGYDLSEVAIRLAKENLRAAGLTNATFHHADAAALLPDASFDFILTWDCLHDMTDPAAAAGAIRSAIKPDGTWLIVDIAGAPTPEENHGHPLAGLLYGFSVLDCLGCGTSAEGGAGLGTLGFPEPAAQQMVTDAGFTHFTRRDFDNPLNAFYEVRP
jgi:2-polyprenyl-3-methyl-5-hydroxy-6-metoxy-1,4-benzoquinol methylase